MWKFNVFVIGKLAGEWFPEENWSQVLVDAVLIACPLDDEGLLALT